MTLSYKKWGRQITAMPTESEQDSEMCGGDHGATHVVTEVKYGFGAQMSFTSRKFENRSKSEIQGSLSIAIKKLGPLASATGSGFLNFSNTENEVVNELRFTFHGDTVIDPPPQTYEDAIQVYKSLPARALEDERVISFSIAPLSEYCNNIGCIYYLLI